jgi:outer membrane lipoprotein LolB
VIRHWPQGAWRLFATGALLAALAGCATPQRSPVAPGVQQWIGRLALTVEGNQSQSFSAGFELKGAPQAGELTLFTPLGGTAAVLQWAPGSATLRSGTEVRQFPSLDALATEVTGAAIPIAALFDWLAGRATEVPGWQVDISQLEQGRLRAQRTAPPPPADLRVAFER